MYCIRNYKNLPFIIVAAMKTLALALIPFLYAETLYCQEVKVRLLTDSLPHGRIAEDGTFLEKVGFLDLSKTYLVDEYHGNGDNLGPPS